MRFLLLLPVLAVLLAGCRVPEDPDGTLDRVEGGVMRVGLTESDPWVVLEPHSGVEVELVRRFARDLGARVRWVEGSEEELIGALKEGALDLVIGGLTKKSRWKKEAALTRPYVSVPTLVGAPPGEGLPDDLDRVKVSVELGSEAEGLLERKTEARVSPVDSLAGVEGPVAAQQYVLDDLGLEPTSTELKKDKHVMALPFGENAWMVRLERFLLNREDEIRRLVREKGRP
jgi:polar amino acid transport system substrate-binding protein